MNNICLNIFGSKIFYNLIKELSIDYNINFFVNKITKQEEIFLKNNIDRKSTRLNSSHVSESRMPSSA